MRMLIQPQLPTNETHKKPVASGPGAPIFENGPQTRIARAPVRAIATVRFAAKEIYGQVLDVSPGGCFLKTEATIVAGTKIDLHITLLGEERRSIADVTGYVRRVGEIDGRRAYGVEFCTSMSQEKQTTLWLYSQALR
jgi:hypothetical protein